MSKSLMEEAIAYFGGGTGFHRLFSLFKSKYESYGRIGGSVKMTGFTDSEMESIARFYGTDPLSLKTKGSVTLLSFERKLQETKYEGIDLKRLLEAYFDAPMLSKKETVQRKQIQMETLISKLKAEYPILSFWLSYLQNRTADTYWIHRMIDENRFSEYCAFLAKALEDLPADFERLPVFSQRISGNPHAFDLSTELGKLWIHVLQVKRGGTALPADTEQINDLLLEFYILRDDITNYVSCANILAETGTEEHPMWKAAAESSSVMNTPMRELLKIKKAYPKNKQPAVWVVENSGVFSSLLDEVPEAPLVCTHGQFKLAALKLLDLLAASGCRIYYSGDFDPEGLAMAARLMQRYPESAEYWRVDIESYKKSNPSVLLSGERLAKLKALFKTDLSDLAVEMKQRKMAGYQEALLRVMAEDLKKGVIK